MRRRVALMLTACIQIIYPTAYSALAEPVTNSQSALGSRAAGIKAYENIVHPVAKPLRHLLYIATPGDSGLSGQSGIIVLDADRGYRFVKRISYGLSASRLPGEEVTGIVASVRENMLFVTYRGHLDAYDLSTDRMVWTFKGEPGGATPHFRYASPTGCCERPWLLPDGKTLLVNSSYNNWVYYIDARSGAVLGKLITPLTPIAHNLVVTSDGKTGFLSSLTGPQQNLAGVTVFDVDRRQVLRTIVFSDAVRPLTINADGSLIYANVNALDGFEIADTKTGQVIRRIELPSELWKAKWEDPSNHYFGHGCPSHGIGLTPDGREIWVTDVVNDAWHVWDNPGGGRDPIFNAAKTIPISHGVDSSWITMTNDGKYAFVGDGSIIDVPKHKVIGLMKDEFGNPIHAAEKLLYLAFSDGTLVEANNQSAVGIDRTVNSKIN